ncbi:MAG: hypothetical protein WDN31_05935 [Hyphomicrobium sp.]
MYAVGIQGRNEPDAAGELRLSRVAQHLAVGADDDRQIAGRNLELLDQNLTAGVALGIEALVGMAVAREKALEPQHVAVFGAADDNGAAAATFKKAHAAQDERTHDPLAELGLGDEQGTQPRGRNDAGLDRSAGDGVDKCRAAAELRQLAHEAAGSWVTINERCPDRV